MLSPPLSTARATQGSYCHSGLKPPLGAAGSKRAHSPGAEQEGWGRPLCCPQPSLGQHLLFKPRLLNAISTRQGRDELWPQLSPRAWLGTLLALILLSALVVAATAGLAQIFSMYKSRTQDRPPRAD